ncbi:Uma2 family endonuclease [Clostridium sp. WILCCON 0269]|uniref:Uma2 family endonuclease n=1 Tax=Candidatus Clostridium eludens TaxID=3381663 RepID=A0ABW8SHU2_9CLOT
MNITNPHEDYELFLKLQSESDDKLEYHNGTIFNMSPTSIKHNDIVNNLVFELKKFFKGTKCKVQSEQIPIIFENQNSKYEYQPDVFVMCNGKTKGEKYISIPAIIFEVLSKTTASNDLFVKPLVYEKFGVKEYNIVHQDGKVIQYGLIDGNYDIISNLTKNEEYKSIAFNDLKFSLKDIFD